MVVARCGLIILGDKFRKQQEKYDKDQIEKIKREVLEN